MAGIFSSPDPWMVTDEEWDKVLAIKDAAIRYELDPVVALKVAHAESELNQGAIGYNRKDGVVWSRDIGIFQINDFYHLASSTSLGLDLYVMEDNIEYAMRLMRSEGTEPWQASKSRWDN